MPRVRDVLPSWLNRERRRTALQYRALPLRAAAARSISRTVRILARAVEAEPPDQLSAYAAKRIIRPCIEVRWVDGGTDDAERAFRCGLHAKPCASVGPFCCL